MIQTQKVVKQTKKGLVDDSRYPPYLTLKEKGVKRGREGLP